MEQAEEHFHKNEPKDFVLRELEMECLYAGQICDDRDVSMFCINQVKENIDLIYDDFRKEMKPHDICRSLKSCE
uniref:Saposin B-type domain-containing protein n=1 Tax=Parastrongyloides trichosuri TaxID=131310 RepID=A0A0N4ZTJ6_PARTI